MTADVDVSTGEVERAEVVPTVRRLSPAEVADTLGCKSKRIVLHWAAKQGMPHDRGEPASGGHRPYLFNLDEVIAWLVSKALPVYRNGAGERTGKIFEEGVKEEGREPASEGEGATPETSIPAAIPVAVALAPPVVEVAAFPLNGEVDWGNLKRAAIERINGILAPPKVKDGEAAVERTPEQISKLADAIKKEIGNLLALDEKMHEADERAGRIVPLAEVRELFHEQFSMFVADLEALTADAPERIIEAFITAGLAPADLDATRRVLTVACTQAIHGLRTRRADAILAATGTQTPLDAAVREGSQVLRKIA